MGTHRKLCLTIRTRVEKVRKKCAIWTDSCAETMRKIFRKKEKAGVHEITWHVWES